MEQQGRLPAVGVVQRLPRLVDQPERTRLRCNRRRRLVVNVASASAACVVEQQQRYHPFVETGRRGVGFPGSQRGQDGDEISLCRRWSSIQVLPYPFLLVLLTT